MRVLKDLKHLPEGIRVKRWLPGWEESFIILLAHRMHLVLYMSASEGSCAPVIF